MLSLGQLYTDDTNDNANNDDDDDNTNNTRWTNHVCIGSLACMPNEPKTLSDDSIREIFRPVARMSFEI